MKKLVSAATSLIMAATMVSAVAPMVASADDASKTVSLLAYKDADLASGVTASGSTVTVSADAIAAGDVVIPVGMYLTESTPEIAALTLDATVKSGPDASKVKFTKVYEGGADFFSAAKSFTIGSNTFETTAMVSFAGSYSKRGGYAPHGTYQTAIADSQPEKNADNAYMGVVWTNNGKKYTEWAGATSDVYPLVVFDVTLPKGLTNGEYVIDFCNAPSTVSPYSSCLLESTSKYSTDSTTKDLTLNKLTIKVGDSAPTSSTTASSATQTTTSTTASNGGNSTTTTTASSTGNGQFIGGNTLSPVVADGDVIFDFTNPDSEDGYWTIDPDEGEYYVDLHVRTKSADVKPTGFTVFFGSEGGITVSNVESKSPAFGSLASDTKHQAMSCTCVGADGHGTAVNGDQIAAYLTYNVPAGTPDGLYRITLDSSEKLSVVKDTPSGAPNEFYSVTVIDGFIKVGEGGTVTTSTTASSATTASTTTTTTTASNAGSSTTTTKKPVTGDPLYGDTNCDGVVKINDVVLLNKYLNDAKSYDISDQGKLNADCYNPKGGAELTPEDSDSIIKSIVHLVTLPVQK